MKKLLEIEVEKNYKTNINIRWCWSKIKKKHWN